METTISINIDNLIRDYCSNFLSYLYKERGWKRTMFEMGKEFFIPSYFEGKEVRIVISNTGTIILTCFSIVDVLNSIEFIVSEFKFGRMGHYCVFDEKTNIKTSYITTFKLPEFVKKQEVTTYYGTITIYRNQVTMKYDSYNDGEELIKIVREMFFSKIDIDDDEQELPFESYLLSFFFLFSGVKLIEYII